VRTCFEGSPRGFEVGCPPYFEPSSPLHHPSYPRAPLLFTEGLSPTRAQAELTDAFKGVKGSTSIYSERTAQLQLILEALCRRAMSGTELHVQVSFSYKGSELSAPNCYNGSFCAGSDLVGPAEASAVTNAKLEASPFAFPLFNQVLETMARDAVQVG
jgi:hypothetical protein